MNNGWNPRPVYRSKQGRGLVGYLVANEDGKEWVWEFQLQLDPWDGKFHSKVIGIATTVHEVSEDDHWVDLDKVDHFE